MAEFSQSFNEFKAANPSSTIADYTNVLAEYRRTRAEALGIDVEELHALGSAAVQLTQAGKEELQTT